MNVARACSPLAGLAAAIALPITLAAQSPAEAWWRHVQVLAHDSLKGRNTGTPGHETASRYIAEQFRGPGCRRAAVKAGSSALGSSRPEWTLRA
ncbi:MAG: hypothetical protein IPK85_10480 [Gemmatimonadetes bacterium]|nr:hypothetical protein [Gemmatimonadota bacterium]